MRCFTDDVLSVRNVRMRRDTIVKGDDRVNVSIIATHETRKIITRKQRRYCQ